MVGIKGDKGSVQATESNLGEGTSEPNDCIKDTQAMCPVNSAMMSVLSWRHPKCHAPMSLDCLSLDIWCLKGFCALPCSGTGI